jgi:hypothetical protein
VASKDSATSGARERPDHRERRRLEPSQLRAQQAGPNLARAIGNAGFASLLSGRGGAVLDGGRVHPAVQSVLASRRGLGAPLGQQSARDLAPVAGDRVADVRVHTDRPAAALARSMRAEAFTTGRDVYFAAGRYQPHSRAGFGLLAHEVAHVAQQGGATASGPLRVAPAGGALEAQAARAARTGATVPRQLHGPVVQRKVSINDDGDAYETDGDRPAWTSTIKATVAYIFSTYVGTTYAAEDTLPSTDRTHIVPYTAIETVVCNYCNGDLDDSEFEELTEVLFPSANGGSVDVSHVDKVLVDAAKKAYADMQKKRDTLVKALGKAKGVSDAVVAAANSLLGPLNSSPDNVRAGDFSINRSISDRWDPVINAKGLSTPRSESMVFTFGQYEDQGFAMDTSGAVRSSQYQTAFNTLANLGPRGGTATTKLASSVTAKPGPKPSEISVDFTASGPVSVTVDVRNVGSRGGKALAVGAVNVAAGNFTITVQRTTKKPFAKGTYDVTLRVPGSSKTSKPKQIERVTVTVP